MNKIWWRVDKFASDPEDIVEPVYVTKETEHTILVRVGDFTRRQFKHSEYCTYYPTKEEALRRALDSWKHRFITINLWQMFWGFIWDISEMSGLGLGRLSPWVFGQMMGCKGKQKKGGCDE